MRHWCSEDILAHFDDPKFAGDLRAEGVLTQVQKLGDEGEQLQLQLQLAKDKVVDARFKAKGNPHVIAVSDWLCGQLIGKSMKKAGQITAEGVSKQLNLPKNRRYCAILAVDALQQILTEAGYEHSPT